jgi:hypothetical protein
MLGLYSKRSRHIYCTTNISDQCSFRSKPDLKQLNLELVLWKPGRAARKFQPELRTPRATNGRNLENSLYDEAFLQLSSKTSELLVQAGDILAFS